MTIDERISDMERVRKHWAERRTKARDGAEEAMCRGWIASTTRVLVRLRKQRPEPHETDCDWWSDEACSCKVAS